MLTTLYAGPAKYHGPNNYRTKAKCRHWTKFTCNCKGIFRQVFIRGYRLEIHPVMFIFYPALWTVVPLNFSLVKLFSPFEKVHVWNQCVTRGGWVRGYQTDNHLPQIPLQVNVHLFHFMMVQTIYCPFLMVLFYVVGDLRTFFIAENSIFGRAFHDLVFFLTSPEIRLEGAIVHKAGRKLQHNWLSLQ